ncbi:MAG: DUF1844 domain-containing protein [Armatimonadetes bacterium]|nr:DUF1844 domain-containing protein [Armatimonadota bacterium]
MTEESPKEPLDVFAVVSIMVEQMTGLAWQKMGLQPDPITGTLCPNMEQAKVAVDIVAELASHLQGQLDESDQRSIRNLVGDLRLNFVQKSNEVTA